MVGTLLMYPTGKRKAGIKTFGHGIRNNAYPISHIIIIYKKSNH